MCLGGGGGQAPNPQLTAQQQNQINQDALNQAARLNQINQVGPYGSVTYTGEIGDPNRTQITTFSPEQQALYDAQMKAGNSLAGLANQRLAGAPGGNFDLGQNPVNYMGAGNTPQMLESFPWGDVPIQTGFDKGPAFKTDVQADPITKSFMNNADQIQTRVDLSGAPDLSTNFDQLTKQAQDADYAKSAQYLDPQFEQDQQALETKLANQGITQGSDAYTREMDNFARRKQSAYSDARNSAIMTGNQQQQGLFGQNLAARQQLTGEQFDLGGFLNSALAQQFGQNQSQAQFQNDAQSLGFDQNLARANLFNEAAMMDYERNKGLAGFQNAAQDQSYGQNMGAAQFANDARTDQFNLGLQQRNFDQNLYQQNLQNQILGRNQNINEAMAYLNGTPIQTQLPTYQGVPQSTAAQAAPDMVGLTASNYQAQQQANAARFGAIAGLAGNIGGAAIRYCWVAREVYDGHQDWLAFREWMLGNAPLFVRKMYAKYGERLAEWLKDKPRTKRVIRSWMDARLNGYA